MCACEFGCEFGCVCMHVLLRLGILKGNAITRYTILVSALLTDKRAPEFLQPLQITKTRAGMQVHHVASFL